MNWKTFVLSLVLFGFVVLTGYAVAEVGYIGLLQSHFNDWGGVQVLVDLVIACGLAVLWMTVDAPQRGINPWPYVVATVFLGSIGPLAYLVRREWRSGVARHKPLQGV
jgi:hypothetical protein